MSTADSPIDSHALAEAIRQQGRSLGFDLVGIASAEPSHHADHLRRWIAAGNAGTMKWMETRIDERCDLNTYFPGIRSVLCVAMNYYAELEQSPELQPQMGRIARYALGQDYHEVMSRKLHELADWLQQIVPGVRTRCGVDTAPILERELAARAGVGWIGKNACVINPRIGSWIVLGEVLTTLELPPDTPITDHCGTCRRCIDACPTGAIVAPYEIDARKCISYLTIEHRAGLDARQQENVGQWLFGCDVCQDVCPWNHRATDTLEPAFAPRFAGGVVDLNEVLEWRANEFNPRLTHSAIKRVKLPILQRNARALLKKQGGALVEYSAALSNDR